MKRDFTIKRAFFTMFSLSNLLISSFVSAQMPEQTANIGFLETQPISNFESPVLATGAFKYQPTATGWTFNSGAGLAKNLSAFTMSNPNAPSGTQVLFVQGKGVAMTTLNVMTSGFYHIRLAAAQRKGQKQSIELLIDNVRVGVITPTNENYETEYSLPVKVERGNHLIQIKGLNPLSTDNTALIDDLSLQRLRSWNNPSTWRSGTVPMTYSVVNIPKGAKIIMEGNCQANIVNVYGTLACANNTDATLSAEGVFAMDGGTLLWGTEETPYLRKGSILLRGTNATLDLMDMGMGAKVLGAMDGGTLMIHGEPRTVWTRLNATADKGVKSITLEKAVDWRIGDFIVIASTDFDANQAEKRQITAVSADKKIFALDSTLKYTHWGVLQKYPNTKGPTILDERAEVALLTRNLSIKGDADSEIGGIGGHTMVMGDAKAFISDVELYRMGQRKLVGRYPFHWHKAGSVSGQYIKNSSIHHSFNRVITVHSSQNALVENNVGYDHIGNGFFLEDGDETGCVFKNNLGILTKKPKPNEQVRPYDLVPSPGNFTLPATFWITNPKNDYIGNVAAGSEGSGFWMVVQPGVIGSGTTSYVPGKEKLGKFDFNRSHSTSFSNFGIDGSVNTKTHQFEFGHYAPFNSDGTAFIPQINGFVAYKCRDRSIWMRTNSMDFRNCVSADNGRATFLAYGQVMYNSLIVGHSDNIGEGPTMRIRGHSIYDGSSGIVDVHFAGFTGDNNFAIQTNGAAQKSTAHFASGISFDAGIPEKNKLDFSPGNSIGYMYSSGLLDLDGSITGTIGARITPIITNRDSATLVRDENFNIQPGSIRKPEWGAYICPPNTTYGLLQLKNNWASGTGIPIYAIRSDGAATYDRQTYGWYSQNPVMVNKDYIYYFQYHEIANKIGLHLSFVNPGDQLIAAFPNMPSSTILNGAISVTSLDALKASKTQAYFFKDNTLYVKFIGSQFGNGWSAQFGSKFSAGSNNMSICLNSNCTDATGRLPYAVLADFEKGNDSRGSLATSNPDVTFTRAVFGATPSSTGNNSISWRITTNGDGKDNYVEYRLNLSKFRQIWTQYKSLSLKFTGAPIRVFIHDKINGYTDLGTYSSKDADNIRLTAGKLSKSRLLSNVDDIILRVYESSIGDLTKVLSMGMTLSEIRLNSKEPTKYSAPQVLLKSVPQSTLDVSLQTELQRANIQWSNNNESQSKFFTLEKLNTTSGEFEEIAIIDANNTNQNENYTLYDNHLIQGENTYQIKVMMLDGTVQKSEIKTLTYDNTNGINIFPNPTSDYIDLDLTQYEGKTCSVSIYNQNGVLLQSKIIDKASFIPVRLNLDRKMNGQMLLKISVDGYKDVTKKFTVQN